MTPAEMARQVEAIAHGCGGRLKSRERNALLDVAQALRGLPFFALELEPVSINRKESANV